jgi:hypothetical protein
MKILNASISFLGLSLATALGCTATTAPSDSESSVQENVGTASSSLTTLDYHGGRVLHTPTVYIIWYGNWPSNHPARTIIPEFLNHLGGSPYWAINTTYGDTTGPVQNVLRYWGSTDDHFSHGTEIGVGWADDDINGVIGDAVETGRLPLDSNGIYLVLTSQDARFNETATAYSFCDGVCGTHQHTSVLSHDLAYAVVGDATTQCPNGCIPAANRTVSPNGSPGVDGMINHIAHELSEATTDPSMNAWENGIFTYTEGADECAWNFQDTFALSNGSTANVVLGSKSYLVQSLLVDPGSSSPYCAQHILAQCGDGLCQAPETSTTCPADCPATVPKCATGYRLCDVTCVKSTSPCP